MSFTSPAEMMASRAAENWTILLELLLANWALWNLPVLLQLSDTLHPTLTNYPENVWASHLSVMLQIDSGHLTILLREDPPLLFMSTLGLSISSFTMLTLLVLKANMTDTILGPHVDVSPECQQAFTSSNLFSLQYVTNFSLRRFKNSLSRWDI